MNLRETKKKTIDSVSRLEKLRLKQCKTKRSEVSAYLHSRVTIFILWLHILKGENIQYGNDHHIFFSLIDLT